MKKLVIIDLNNIIYRAYFGIQQPLKGPDGKLINAVYGTFNMIYNIISELKPTAIVAALDSRKSDRKEEFEYYKSNRSKMPDDLRHQIPMINELLKALNIQTVEESGLEADDLIYSLVEEGSLFDQIYIISGDKDLMQLVNDRVFIYDSMKQIKYTKDEVIKKFGVNPNQIVDYLSLVGDSSDSIPGVTGIGEKGAVKLLQEFSTLENLYEHIDTVKPAGVQKKLLDGKKDAFLSKSLAVLRKAKTSIIIEKWNLDKAKATEKLQSWNMRSAVDKISRFFSY